MKFALTLLVTLFFVACHTGPQPLVPGKDECYFCKMPVADIKFGAEIITAKGKIYKFDDVGCMLHFLKEGLAAEEKVEKILAVNYNNSQKLMDVHEAVFLKSSDIHSPMNSGIAAFESRSEAESLHKETPSEVLTWQQLSSNPK